eukprot:NODE_1537_length_1301_cov_1.582624_g1523_i0.p3 GENE.NODE_1537_length_1301_cov_1.582624_g1523_i0~~NODE_1537_length_1301_cov_1.582624_g1523_i0.p3  ORF type:complete len:121 (-),score=12.76 NODE_1537_length_1301_cov_1.582624_g1523_i0:827-1189(-)
MCKPIQHQGHKQPGHQGGFANIDLRLHKEMQRPQNRNRINQFVQARPFRTKPAHCRLGRGRGKDSKPDQGDKPDRQINPKDDLACDPPKIKVLTDGIKPKMNHPVTKGRNTDLAAHLHQL